jgi:hypothetical protein
MSLGYILRHTGDDEDDLFRNSTFYRLFYSLLCYTCTWSTSPPTQPKKKYHIYSYIKRDSAHVKLYNDKLVSFLFGFVFVSGYDKWGPMRSSGRDSRDLDARDRQDIYYAHDMSTCTQPVAVCLVINNKYHTAERENPLVSFHFNSTIMMCTITFYTTFWTILL